MMIATETPAARPTEFPFEIRGGVLNSMGIQMYSTLGKCLVEFVANAYDGDATAVQLTIPFARMDEARQDILKRAREAKAEGRLADRDRILAEALPDDITVEIVDDGTGMSPRDIIDKFLPLNRQRRADAHGNETCLHSDSGRRFVMGRKGLGKLAGFGAAERVTVTTKRAGDSFATRFVMDATKLRQKNLGEVMLIPEYLENEPADDKYTKVTLSGLKSEAVKYGSATITSTLQEAFWAVDADDFAIALNGAPLEPAAPEYEYEYPPAADRGGDLMDEVVKLDDYDDLSYRFIVKFRKSGHHLRADQRGARVYCNKRLAAGPSLFNLGTGMHNFHAQSYMECVVVVDQLDRLNVDLINTNRTKFRDNPLVEAFVNSVTEKMRLALATHAAFKEKLVAEQIEKEDALRELRATIDLLPARTRASARKLVEMLGAREGVNSDFFKTTAPLIVRSLRGGDVILKLMDLKVDPKTIADIARELTRLAEVENGDALKVMRARREGLLGLGQLVERGKDLWKRVGIEDELQALLQACPWLIEPQFSRYLTSSNVAFGTVVNDLAEKIGIVPSTQTKDAQRPDLVFLLLDQAQFTHVVVVELKSPTIPLDITHLAQLKRYMRKAEEYASTALGRTVKASGYLIGSRNPIDATPNDATKDLDREIADNPNAPWKVVDIRQLFERAREANMHELEVLERVDSAHAEQELQKAGKVPIGEATDEEDAPKVVACEHVDALLVEEQDLAKSRRGKSEVYYFCPGPGHYIDESGTVVEFDPTTESEEGSAKVPEQAATS